MKTARNLFIDRQDGLTKIVFQEGLGNLADKTERLLKLGRVFGEECGLHEDAAVVLERATELAKTDLTNRYGYRVHRITRCNG